MCAFLFAKKVRANFTAYTHTYNKKVYKKIKSNS